MITIKSQKKNALYNTYNWDHVSGAREIQDGFIMSFFSSSNNLDYYLANTPEQDLTSFILMFNRQLDIIDSIVLPFDGSFYYIQNIVNLFNGSFIGVGGKYIKAIGSNQIFLIGSTKVLIFYILLSWAILL